MASACIYGALSIVKARCSIYLFNPGALKLKRELLKKQGFVPDSFTTDKLPSYSAALKDLGLSRRDEFCNEAVSAWRAVTVAAWPKHPGQITRLPFGKVTAPLIERYWLAVMPPST